MKLPDRSWPGVAIVGDVLADDLAEALHQAAVQLALDQLVVIDRAAIVGGDVVDHGEFAGVGIDLDLGDMRAGGKALARSIVVLVSSGGRFAPFALDQRLHADRQIGAGDLVGAVLEHDVARRDLEFARRELRAFLDDLLGGGLQRGAVADQRARAERTGAEHFRRRGVVVAQLDLVRGMPSTSATIAGNTVSWPWPDGPALEYIASRPPDSMRISTCSLPMPPDGSRNSASPMPRSLPRRFGFPLPLAEAFPVRRLQRGLEQTRRVGAVVIGIGRRPHREHVLAQQIAAAQLDGIDAGDDRGFFDQAFPQIGDIRPPGAAIGRGRRCVGEHQPCRP